MGLESFHCGAPSEFPAIYFDSFGPVVCVGDWWWLEWLGKWRGVCDCGVFRVSACVVPAIFHCSFLVCHEGESGLWCNEAGGEDRS